MDTQEPTFLPLGGHIGWPKSTSPPNQHVAVSKTGIRLAAAVDDEGQPTGPLSLNSLDDSLGGLTLPRGVALDADGLLYLLSLRKPHILRFDPALQRFSPIQGVGGCGREARLFRQPANIAVAGCNLYVADRGNRRVQVFALAPALPLRFIWGPWDKGGQTLAVPVQDDQDAPGAVSGLGASCEPPSPEIPEDIWDPADVAAHADQAYILDCRHGRVYRHRSGTDPLVLVVDEPAAQRRWSRIAVDQAGSIYLLDRHKLQLDVYSPTDQPAQVQDANEVRDRFDSPAIRLHYRTPHDDPAAGRFCLPAGLMRPCNRRVKPAPSLENPLGFCIAPAQPTCAATGLVFDREGRLAPFDPAEAAGPCLYATHGVWYSGRLDSSSYHCQWHRIEMKLTDLPAGCRVVVSTYSADEGSGPQSETSPLWILAGAVTGPMQPPPAQAPAPRGVESEFLVQSRAGRYLWLKFELSGDGYSTPAIQAMRLHYPRKSYLEHLPAVYSSDEDCRWFLERFLSVFQTEWDALDRQVEDSPAWFDPAAVPAGLLMANLTRWLALPLEGRWSDEQKRTLLKAVPSVYPQRGTRAGLRLHLQAYLQNMVGLAFEEQGAYPLIIEGFYARRWLMLCQQAQADLGFQSRLWGPKMVRRLQLDVFAQEGEVQLVSTGDPERDVFHAYAHQFRIFMPAAWVQTAEDERMIRRAIAAEKPAHTSYELCLVEARFRIGVQSTLGIDTIIGAYPVAHLACLCQAQELPSSAAPSHCLGYDTILGGRRTEPMHLAPETRVGIETILA